MTENTGLNEKAEELDDLQQSVQDAVREAALYKHLASSQEREYFAAAEKGFWIYIDLMVKEKRLSRFAISDGKTTIEILDKPLE